MSEEEFDPRKLKPGDAIVIGGIIGGIAKIGISGSRSDVEALWWFGLLVPPNEVPENDEVRRAFPEEEMALKVIMVTTLVWAGFYVRWDASVHRWKLVSG